MIESICGVPFEPDCKYPGDTHPTHVHLSGRFAIGVPLDTWENRAYMASLGMPSTTRWGCMPSGIEAQCCVHGGPMRLFGESWSAVLRAHEHIHTLCVICAYRVGNEPDRLVIPTLIRKPDERS